MNRPPGYAWEPLQLDADPVPGDTDAITQEIAHLTSVGDTIRQQIANLRKIATGGVEVGQHAEAIQSSAATVADSLGPAEARYEKVATALTSWVQALGAAQQLSLTALGRAEGPYETLIRAGAAFLGSQLIIPESIAGQPAVQEARAEHAAAVSLLSEAVADRDNAAAACASTINSACNDSLKDSLWQRFENDWDNLVHDFDADVAKYAWLIKDICEGLEVAAALAGLVLLFATGLGEILIPLMLIATAIALSGRVLLAATGNGSWTDVALDTVALVTLGASSVAGEAADAIVQGATKAGDEVAAAERAASVPGQVAADVVKIVMEVKPSEEVTEVMLRQAGTLQREAEALFPDASRVAEQAKVTVWQKLAWGSADLAKTNAQLTEIGARFPDEASIASAAGRGGATLNQARVAGLVSLGAGAVPGLGGFPIYGPNGWQESLPHPAFWDRLEDDTTHSVPGLVGAYPFALPAYGVYTLARSAL